MGLCIGRENEPKERALIPASHYSKSSRTASLPLTDMTLDETPKRQTIDTTHDHLLHLICPNDPILQDMDFIRSKDIVHVSKMIDCSFNDNTPVQQVAALAIQNKTLKMKMEDACVMETNIICSDMDPIHFYAVYDGHGGSFVSQYLAQHLHHEVARQYEAGVPLERILAESFLAIDTVLESFEEADLCGSTAVVWVCQGSRVTIANLGDSHCLYFDGNQCKRLTQDHHVRNQDEVTRIRGNRGIILNQRVSGVSKVTRAFGQNDEKDFIISTPSLVSLDLSGPRTCGGYFVLMSDGVTDVLRDEEIASLVCQGLTARWSLSLICQSILDICKLKRARDNMSLIVIRL